MTKYEEQSRVELLPCPFCGGVPKINRRGDAHGIFCDCNNTCFVQAYGGSRDEAARRWNARATPSHPDKLEVVEREQRIYDDRGKTVGWKCERCLQYSSFRSKLYHLEHCPDAKWRHEVEGRIATYRNKLANENPPPDTANELRFAIEAFNGVCAALGINTEGK